MLKSIQIVWSPGHCGLSGNEQADHQIKLGAAETQPDNALNPLHRELSSNVPVSPSHTTRAAEGGVHDSP